MDTTHVNYTTVRITGMMGTKMLEKGRLDRCKFGLILLVQTFSITVLCLSGILICFAFRLNIFDQYYLGTLTSEQYCFGKSRGSQLTGNKDVRKFPSSFWGVTSIAILYPPLSLSMHIF